MYCSFCGKKLEDGEICSCRVYSSDETMEKEEEVQAGKTAKVRKKTAAKIVLVLLLAVLAATVSYCALDWAMSVEPEIHDISREDVFTAYEGDYIIENKNDAQYTSGKLNGNVYTNNWANIKIVFENRFSNAPAQNYEPYENFLFDCGAYFIAEDDGDTLGIAFYNAGDMTVREYCEESLDSWIDSVKDYYDEVFSPGFMKKITVEKSARDIRIAGESFLGSFLKVNLDGESYVTYGDFCAEKDGRIIDIIAIADDVGECIDLMNSVTKLKDR